MPTLEEELGVSEPIHYVLVLDESLSMKSLRDDVIEGFNEQLEDIKELDNIKVTVIKFSGVSVSKIRDAVDLEKVEELTKNDYSPGGSTPLNDAIGFAVETISEAKYATVVVFTDGQENSSQDYDTASVKGLIDDKDEWEFVFFGCEGINTIEEAAQYGFDSSHLTANTSEGTEQRYTTSTETLKSYTAEVRGDE